MTFFQSIVWLSLTSELQTRVFQSWPFSCPCSEVCLYNDEAWLISHTFQNVHLIQFNLVYKKAKLPAENGELSGRHSVSRRRWAFTCHWNVPLTAFLSAGSAPGEQDAEASEVHPGSLFGHGHRHLPLHQPGNHRIHVLWRAHRRQHHAEPT